MPGKVVGAVFLTVSLNWSWISAVRNKKSRGRGYTGMNIIELNINTMMNR